MAATTVTASESRLAQSAAVSKTNTAGGNMIRRWATGAALPQFLNGVFTATRAAASTPARGRRGHPLSVFVAQLAGTKRPDGHNRTSDRHGARLSPKYRGVMALHYPIGDSHRQHPAVRLATIDYDPSFATNSN